MSTPLNMISPQNKIILAVTVTLVLLGGIAWRISPSFKKTVSFFEKPKVVNDTLVIPETTKITTAGGRSFGTSGYQVPLVPKTKGEEVIVPSAVFTIKTGFDLAFIDAKKWSSDAKLVYAKSLGTVTLNGKSSAWQYAFGSKNKKKGDEVIIQGDSIVSQKETVASSYGYALPKNWFDSGDAILSLPSLPQFPNATVSSLIFFYSEDGKIWEYAIATSFGNTTMLVH